MQPVVLLLGLALLPAVSLRLLCAWGGTAHLSDRMFENGVQTDSRCDVSELALQQHP